jgi:transcription antitermination factor NusG
MPVPHWCVVSFFGQAEISAARELTRQGYETYLPLTAIRRRDPVIASMWHVVRVPLLSGYGFLRLTQAESREPILATRGVRELLRRPDGRLAWVRDAEIEAMQAGDEARLLLPKEHRPVLAKGAPVRVETGPFAGFPGAVLECDGIKTRVEIMIFGRATPMWLDRAAVVAV